MLKSLFSKSLSFKLPLVIKTSYEQVKTDIRLSDALALGRIAFGIKDENINFNTLPGVATFKLINGKNLSYYIYDEIETKKLIENMYGVIKKAPTK